MSVICGAGRNSDHMLLRAKFVVGSKRYFSQSKVICEEVGCSKSSR